MAASQYITLSMGVYMQQYFTPGHRSCMLIQLAFAASALQYPRVYKWLYENRISDVLLVYGNDTHSMLKRYCIY